MKYFEVLYIVKTEKFHHHERTSMKANIKMDNLLSENTNGMLLRQINVFHSLLRLLVR
jgi:hypothetical protein